MRHKCAFLIDEAGLNELRVRMITLAEIVPSPKDVATLGEAPLRGLSGAGRRVEATGRGWQTSGRFRICDMSLQGSLYAVRPGSGLADWGGRDYELLEHMG